DGFARGGGGHGGGFGGGGLGGGRVGGGFGAGHGSFEGAHPGGRVSGTGTSGGTGTAGVNPLLTLPLSQTPPPAILNPGVTPSAPGPSRITPSAGSSAGLSTATNPGFANGMSSSIAPGRVRAARSRTSEDQSRAVNELDREIDRNLNICRGCYIAASTPESWNA